MNIAFASVVFVVCVLLDTVIPADASRWKGKRGAEGRSGNSAFSGLGPSYQGSGASFTRSATDDEDDDGLPPTLAPVLNAGTKAPSKAPVLGKYSYEFTTVPVKFPTMNAQTNPPDSVPVDDANTSVPSTSSTIVATMGVTNTPTDSSGVTPPVFSTAAPTNFPTSSTFVATSVPSQMDTIFETDFGTGASSSKFSSLAPTVSPTLLLDAGIKDDESNVSTEPCKSNGSFFINKENDGTISSFVYDLDVLSFSYELEALPGTSVEDILPTLERAFVNRMLPMLFPSDCGNQGIIRRLEEVSIVGVSAVPDDEVTDVDCASKTEADNECVVMNGKLSIFTEEGDSDLAVRTVGEALRDAMNRKEFNEAHENIVRVSYRSEDTTQSESGEDSLTDSDADTMSPPNEGEQLLTISLTTLSAAGVVFIAIGVSIYRRNQKLKASDDTTLQGASTLNGLSRFDAPAHETQEQDIDILPASPNGRNASYLSTTFYEL